MRILMTGGAGFIASHIQDAYISQGHEVAVLDNLSSGQKENLHPQAKFYEIDIRDPQLKAVLEEFRPEIINHHAAQINVRHSVENPAEDCEINALGLINLMEAARSQNVKKVIFASSGGAIYGEQQTFPADENHPTEPASPYGITKLISEKYLDFYQKTYGIPSVILRYANVYGPRQNPHGEAGVIAIFLQKMLRGETVRINGDGLQTRDYVFVTDVVAANELALQEGVSGVYNIGTGVETSVWDIFNTLAAELNYSQEPAAGPAQLGEQRRSVLSAAKIKSALGWEARYSLKEGIQRIIKLVST